MTAPNVYTSSSGLLSSNTEQLKSLIDKAKKGDQAAFSELYTLFFKKIYRFIYFRVGHKEVAEDLAEEVFIKAYGKISSINKPESFEGWLYQIARNRIIDYYREKKITIALEEVENTLEYDNSIVDQVQLQQEQSELLAQINQLTSEQQAVIKMKFLEDLSNSEIASIIKKTEGAVRVIQHRAIAKLQELISNQHKQQ